MAKEIERKFLVDAEGWGKQGNPVEMCQAYLTIDSKKIIRVRIAADKAFITIKGNQEGITRDEFEYEVPVADAFQMMKMCEGNTVEKTRYNYNFAGKLWEIDVFHGANNGLIVAEIELESEDEPFEKPHWIREEVSTEVKYYNFWLSKNPFSQWQ